MLDADTISDGDEPPEEGEAALAAAIRRRARDFDAPALVALLSAKFPGRALRFRGRPSFSPRPTIVEDVAFAPDHVLVTLNLGLRSSSGPLPSYFHDLLAHPRAGPALEDLLDLLDDRLLRDRVDALQAEQASRYLPRVGDVRRDALALARPASPATLRWIFGQVYPELAVTVRRTAVRRELPAEDPRLGQAVLGHAALGGEAEVAAPGLDVILTSDESTTWRAEPWIGEARSRLHERVFPALAGTSAHLRVFFVDREAEGLLALPGPSRIGFDVLVRARPPKVIILFEGPTPR